LIHIIVHCCWPAVGLSPGRLSLLLLVTLLLSVLSVLPLQLPLLLLPL
jgi:hypothetical protein